MACSEVEDIIDKFNTFTQKPVKFLTIQDDLHDDLKNLVKSLYDFTKSQEKCKKNVKKSALPELIIRDFDEEQIWQEIELQNNECWDNLVWDVSNCMSGKVALQFPVQVPREQEPESEDLQSDGQDLMSDEDTHKQPKKPKCEQPKLYRKSIVDDKFFKLQEMEQFLLNEEKRGDNKPGSDSDEETIDMFENMDDDEKSEGDEDERKDMMYGDFFDGEDYGIEDQGEVDDSENYSGNEGDVVAPEPKKTKRKVKFAGLMPDDDSESESDNRMETPKGQPDKITNKSNEKKSEFELRQQRLQQQILRLEDKTLTEASWQLKGEVDASKRPQNSLLQEVVDFDLTTRPPPIITEETTVTLEDIIMRRIKDKAWDDVVKKEKPVDDQLMFRKPEVLDQAKSKMSLAQVYEAEYLKQKQAMSGNKEDEKEPESHTEVRNAMSKLFLKLDALCHYHYTPRAPQAEVKIVSNTPAISMEEVAPVATSDAALLAPEEVKKRHRGDLMSKEERTQTDKKRERRKKKKFQQKKGLVSKVTEHRNTKKGVEANDKSLKTSKAFFQQLNDDATSIIKNKQKRNVKNKGL